MFTPEERLKPPPTNQRIGLGDAVHFAAQPVVLLVDALGGHLAGCGGCHKRREDWNKAVPDVRHPFRRK